MIMGLSVRDILILDYFDGKPVHTKVPAYQEKVLGPHANQRIPTASGRGMAYDIPSLRKR